MILESWVGSFLAIGAFCGALPAGLLAERIGRKFTTITIGVPYIVSYLLLALASNVPMLYAGRFMSGIATGASCVVAPMFIGKSNIVYSNTHNFISYLIHVQVRLLKFHFAALWEHSSNFFWSLVFCLFTLSVPLLIGLR